MKDTLARPGCAAFLRFVVVAAVAALRDVTAVSISQKATTRVPAADFETQANHTLRLTAADPDRTELNTIVASPNLRGRQHAFWTSNQSTWPQAPDSAAPPFEAMPPIESTAAISQDNVAKVFFLFLTYSGMSRKDLWTAFFQGAPVDKYRLLMHCKDQKVCDLTSATDGSASKVTIVRTVQSSYCTDLISPMAQLLRTAASESSSPNDKFVFVSETTLPIKPFSFIYKQLTANQNSDFCIDTSDGWVSLKSKNGEVAYIPKHSQWVVLNKEHADLLVQRWPRVKKSDIHGFWSIPTFDVSPEVHDSKFVTVSPQVPLCADEWAIFATIFGVIGLQSQPKLDIPDFTGSPLWISGWRAESQDQGTCRTFATWGWTSSKHAQRTAQEISSDSSGSKLSCYPICHSSSPATIEKLSDRGLKILKNSQYFFARKFDTGVVTLKQFQSIILQP